MRKGLAHRLARLAVAHHAGQHEVRMPGDQPQQFAGHVAGSTEYQRGYARLGHQAALTITALPVRPAASMAASPSAAGLLIALNARTPVCCWMMSTPTWLSVAGPV